MRRLLGGILLAIGILVAGLSGLCTLLVLGGSLTSGQFIDGLSMALAFGGIPLAIGIGLIFAGRALLKENDDSVPPAVHAEPDPNARPAHPLAADDETDASPPT